MSSEMTKQKLDIGNDSIDDKNVKEIFVDQAEDTSTLPLSSEYDFNDSDSLPYVNDNSLESPSSHHHHHHHHHHNHNNPNKSSFIMSNQSQENFGDNLPDNNDFDEDFTENNDNNIDNSDDFNDNQYENADNPDHERNERPNNVNNEQIRDEYQFEDDDDQYRLAQEFIERSNLNRPIDIDRILGGVELLLHNVSEEIRNYRDEAIGLLNYPRERYLDYVQLHNEIENAPIPVEALSDLGEEISDDDGDDQWENEAPNFQANQLEMAGDPGPYYDQFRREHQQVEQHRMYINGQIEPEAGGLSNNNSTNNNHDHSRELDSDIVHSLSVNSAFSQLNNHDSQESHSKP